MEDFYDVKKGEEYILFPENTILLIQKGIAEEIANFLKKEPPTDKILGAFAINSLELKNGDRINAWIEYNANILPFGIVDAGVHRCILFHGDLPDIVLDRYNEVKKTVII